MRFRRRACLVLTLVCIGATFYEIPNARLIWRYVFRGPGRESTRGDGAALVSDEVIASDPEAGAILRYCLGDPNDPELAELVARYPQNEFFLAQFAERLLDVNCVDHQAALIVADELITLSPENAHYRYLKGWALLKPPRDAGEDREALEQFEMGNSLPDFYLPHSLYKERVDRLCETADLRPWDRRKAQPGETGIYFDLGPFLSRSQGPYATLDPNTCYDLSVAAVEISKRLIDGGETFGRLEHGMFLLQLTERTNLREFELSPEEARQARLHLGQALALSEMLQRWFEEAFASGIALMETGIVAIVPLTFGAQVPFLWLFLVIVNLLRGRADPAPVGVRAYVLFVTGLVGFYCLLVVVALLNRLLPGASLASLAFILVPTVAGATLWLLAHLRPLDHARFRRGRHWAAVVCGSLWLIVGVAFAIDLVRANQPAGMWDWLALAGLALGWSALWLILWAIGAYRQHAFRAIPFDRVLRWRIVQMVLLLCVATGTVRLVWGVPLLPAVLAFVALLLAGTIAVHSTERRIIAWDALRRFFAREGQIAITRAKLAHVISVVLLVCWSAILVGVHLSAGTWRRLGTLWTDPLALYGPVPQATQDNYERLIVASAPEQTHRGPWDQDAGVPENLYLAAPEDVTAFLAERQASSRALSDTRLQQLAVRGGRDIRPVVLGAMTDPYAREVLLRRAEWGDASVKERLVSLFEKEFAELGEPFMQIRQDPNCLPGLILKARWGEEDAKTELERLFTVKMTEVLNAPPAAEDRDRLRSELGDLVTINEALISLSEHGHVGRFMRRNRERSDLLERLLIDADMRDIEPSVDPPEIAKEDLESLLDIAEALAFVSKPQEAKARFQWLMAPLRERQRQDRDLRRRSRSRSRSGAGFAACLFYRVMRGLPHPESAALLKEYTKASRLSELLEEQEFLDLLPKAGDRMLAEQVLQRISESAPSETVIDTPDSWIITAREDLKTHREDTSHAYLEPVFGCLTGNSIPVLLEHLGSDNGQLRAFAVWRLTSLGYDWPKEERTALLADAGWKVRLNALFACDADELRTANADDNTIVRTISRLLLKKIRQDPDGRDDQPS